MVKITSFSHGDELDPIIQAGAEAHGTKSKFLRELIEMWADALARYGHAPTRDEFTAHFLEAKAGELNRKVALTQLELQRVEALKQEQRKKEAAREAATGRRYRNPDELVNDLWPTFPTDPIARREVLKQLARDHNFQERAVFQACGRRVKMEADRQTNLRVLPAPTSQEGTFGKAAKSTRTGGAP